MRSDLFQPSECDIDGDQEVFSSHLHPVACIVNDSDIGCFGAKRKIVDRLHETAQRLVDRFGDIEADRLQRLSHTLCVVVRIVEWYHVAIGRHADDKCDAAGVGKDKRDREAKAPDQSSR